MKKRFWILTLVGIILLSGCGSSKEAKVLQQKIISLVGIPQDIVTNICQDDNSNGICELTELQAKITFDPKDTKNSIFSKLTLTSEGRYLLETYDPSKALLLELKDRKSRHYKESFTLPFNGLTAKEENKDLSILQSMIDKEFLAIENVSSAKVMKNVGDFYKILLADLEENMKILTLKGLSVKEAVLGNINEMAQELISNGIENTIPAKMNACNGDQVCVNAVLNRLSIELVLTDEEADAILIQREHEAENFDPHENYNKLDFSNYFPKSSVVKQFTSKELSSYNEEEISTYNEIISKKGNILTYKDSNGENESSSLTINSNMLIVRLNNGDYDNNEYEVKRYLNIGEPTFNWRYSYHQGYSTVRVNYNCILEDQLNNFSHGTYQYVGDIVVEKCLMTTETSYTLDDNVQKVNSSRTYYNYRQKNIGEIASISDVCYNEQGVAEETQGCTPNGHTYEYLEK